MVLRRLATAYAVHNGSSAKARNACLRKLHALGVAAAVGTDGEVVGQFWMPVNTLPRIDGIGVAANVRFSCKDHVAIVFEPPSPLSRLEPVEFFDLHDRDALSHRVSDAWRALVVETEAAVARARRMAPNARVRLDPFRIEGTVRYLDETIQLLFATKGHRACISGIGDRAVAFQPSERRAILSVDRSVPNVRDPEWDFAVGQARACLGPAPVATVEERQHSIDLVSLDLSSDDLP